MLKFAGDILMTTNQLHIWATPFYAPMEISDALSRLRISHSIGTRTKRRVVSKGYAQPKLVHVGTTLDSLVLEAVNFITAPASQIELTNYPMFPSITLEDALKVMLTSPRKIQPKVTKLTEVDYVDMVAKPSLLSKIQSAILRIQPYDLRKECNAMVLAYLNHEVGERKLKPYLNKSYKFEALKDLLGLAGDLREGTRLIQAGGDSQVVADSLGLPAFDLNYINSKRIK